MSIIQLTSIDRYWLLLPTLYMYILLGLCYFYCQRSFRLFLAYYLDGEPVGPISILVPQRYHNFLSTDFLKSYLTSNLTDAGKFTKIVGVVWQISLSLQNSEKIQYTNMFLKFQQMDERLLWKGSCNSIFSFLCCFVYMWLLFHFYFVGHGLVSPLI